MQLAKKPQPIVPDARPVLEVLRGRVTQNTWRSYECSYRDFAAFCGLGAVLGSQPTTAALAALLALGRVEANLRARQYQNNLIRRGLSPATVNARVRALRSFVRECRDIGLVDWKLKLKDLPTESYRDTRGPGADKILSTLSTLSASSIPLDVRDCAIMWLLYGQGLRRAEVAALDIADYDVPGRRLSIIGKMRREPEWIGLADKVAEALDRWLAVLCSFPNYGLLFIALDKVARGHRLTGKSINDMVHRRGLGNAHGLRHSGATELLDRSNGNHRITQAWGRWKDASIVGIYDDNRQDLARQAAEMITR